MKGIRKTLVASVLAYSTTLHAQAEVNPFSGGIKAGGSLSAAWGQTEEAKFGIKKAKGKFFDTIWFSASLYGEYAFTEYLGAGVEASYMKQGATLEAEPESTKDKEGEQATKNPAISMASHGIYLPVSLYIYPMGREEEEGILKIYAGPSFFFPMNTRLKEGKDAENELKRENLTEDQKNELPSFDLGAHLGLAYEFPFGLLLDLRGGMNFRNRFNKADDKDQTIFRGVQGLKKMKTFCLNFNLGYNIASFFY